jgi:anti-anti-sigma factor
VLNLAGEFELASAPLAAEWITRALDATETHVILDLRDVSFIDSRALAVLVRMHQQAQSAGKTVVVRRPSKRAMDLFLMTGLDQLLVIESHAPEVSGSIHDAEPAHSPSPDANQLGQPIANARPGMP